MLVGDSVTQGSAGDWTWRHRLARHLESLGVRFELVGPRTTLYDNVAGVQNGSTSYVDPDFDRDHAALWGMTAAFAEPIGRWVSEQQPDVVVEMLGVNDLNPILGPEDETAAAAAARAASDVHDFVDDARRVDPELDLVLAQATQSWIRGVPELNEQIGALAADLDSTGSRVELASTAAGFTRADDTWDGTHPSSWGEIKIAAAVSEALARLGIGAPMSEPLPQPARGPRLPSTLLTAEAGDGEVALSWTASPGADRTRLEVRDVTANGGWQLLASVRGTAHLATGLPNGHVLEFRVRPVKGFWPAADDMVSAVLRSRPRPAQPGAVAEVLALGVAHGVDVSWSAAPWADSYLVWWREPRGGWSSASVTSTSLQVRSLVAGADYEVSVQPVGRAGLGERTAPVTATAQGPVPRAPTPTVTVGPEGDALVSWAPVADATAYVVQWRAAIESAWRTVPADLVGGNSMVLPALTSRMGYSVRVRADHMRLTGPWSAGRDFVVPPLPAVRGVRARQRGRTLVASARAVSGATGYLLSTKGASRCTGRPPAESRWRTRQETARPRLALPARGRAIWVRWVAVRDSVPGATARSSAACVPLRR